VSGLLERLERLLAEANECGELGQLAGILESTLADIRSAERRQHEDEEIPRRFGMIGESAPMVVVFDLIERVAPSNVAVLVYGETGTGKELVARALHNASSRKGQMFLAENCAAVPANLLESELFGHKKGSFTHAIADRKGHFVAADGGTLFLDEIGDMPIEMQAKLLRVLETGEIRPVGSNVTCKVDVRIVAATHRNLSQMVKERSFREDLFYRLNVIQIELPPLHERLGDIAHLVCFFLQECAEKGSAPRVLAPDALSALEAFAWPGNVRQLENEIRRACALSSGRIEKRDLSAELQN